MRILLLNQCFYPDHVSTAQHLSDLALALADRGHHVTALASSRGYDNPERRYPIQESWKGVDIHRVWVPGLGKKSMWRRLIDALVFWLNSARMLFTMPKHDVVISLTSPPLISLMGALAARKFGGKSMIWLMDMNPDQAVANGVLKKGSLVEKTLASLLNWSFQQAAKTFVLDRFMAQRLRDKGVSADTIHIDAPWSHDQELEVAEEDRLAFRREHGLEGKFVVMYSGNHSPCHPLDTVLEAAKQMRDHPTLHFLFVGGGSEHKKVAAFASQHSLTNVQCLPYQPLSKLSASLSSADLHLVVMGDPYVGIVHPCKIYNILFLGLPFLYIGPIPSHVGDLVDSLQMPSYARMAQHGEVEKVIEHLTAAVQNGRLPFSPELRTCASHFSFSALSPRLVAEIERSEKQS